MAKLSSAANPKVDAYIAKSAPFAQPILEYLRDLVHEAAPMAVEEIKWSRPFFVINGVILGNISAFKAHCSFGLWGAEVAALMKKDGAKSEMGMGTFGKITSIKDLPPRKKLLGYLAAAVDKITSGEREVSYKRPRVVKPEAEVPPALAAALKKNKAANTVFTSAAPGFRREYCLWITEAKREETQNSRIATAIEWITEGKSRNWKYEK
jgi:uncharacterized protein YdeI (YjbR/CyaY-like superfamily)